VISALHGAIMSKNLTVVFKYGKQLPGLMIGDRFRVEHVVSNLLSNAIKFSPDNKEIVIDIDGELVRKSVYTNAPDNAEINRRNSTTVRNLHARLSGKQPMSMNITIAITDAGPGISSANQAKLFNNFVQIRPQALQKGQGSGLGLALCKAIVELHNGTIGVRVISLLALD